MNGSVKFYNRAKYYGFIIPNDQPDLDVFVHRSDILSDLPHDEHPRYPSLAAGERVRFQLDWVTDESDGTKKPHARNVIFSNGQRIPPLRKFFWRNKMRNIQDELGKQVFAIMTDDTIPNPDPQEQWERVQGAWKIAKYRLDSAKKLVDRVGMRIEDFPEDDQAPKQSSNVHNDEQELPWLNDR